MQDYKASKSSIHSEILIQGLYPKNTFLGEKVSCDWKRGNFGFMEEVYFSFIKHTGSKNTNMDFFNS